MEFQDKVVLISGGAAGLGKEIAKCFGREGAKISICDKNMDEGNRTCSELREAGAEAVFFECDVRSEQDIVATVAKTVEIYGRIDVLVNNVGMHFCKQIPSITAEYWGNAFDINARGHFLFIRETVPVMKSIGKGSIVNVSSIHALVTTAGSSVYAATKGAIVSMTYSIAIELAPFNIRINVILPGAFRGSWIDKKLETLEPEQKDKFLQRQSSNRIPMGRVADSEEIAWPVLFMASDKASYITGSVLVVDGGRIINL